jgi:PleD family two-component response regulator
LAAGAIFQVVQNENKAKEQSRRRRTAVLRNGARGMSQRSTVIRIVDDDALVRAALERLLRLAGYDVRCYASAGEFLLEKSTRDAPGCMLLDLFTPGLSGHPRAG